MNRSRLVTPVAIVVGLGAVVLPTAGAASAPSICSAKGLHYTSTSASAMFSVTVERLRATAVPCGTARSVAADVAKRDLAANALPKTSHGFKIAVVNPCTACSPNTMIAATAGARKITFTLAGGK